MRKETDEHPGTTNIRGQRIWRKRELALVEREEVKNTPALGWCLEAETDTDYIDRDRFVAVPWSQWAARLGQF